MKELKIYQLDKIIIESEVEAGEQCWIADEETLGIKPVKVIEILKETEDYFYILTEV